MEIKELENLKWHRCFKVLLWAPPFFIIIFELIHLYKNFYDRSFWSMVDYFRNLALILLIATLSYLVSWMLYYKITFYILFGRDFSRIFKPSKTKSFILTFMLAIISFISFQIPVLFESYKNYYKDKAPKTISPLLNPSPLTKEEELLNMIRRGKKLIKQGKEEEGSKILQDALKINLENETDNKKIKIFVFSLLGKTKLNKNLNRDALDYFSKIKALDSNNAAADLGLAEAYYNLGHHDRVNFYLGRVIAFSSDNEEIKKAKELFTKISPYDSGLFVFSDPPGAIIEINQVFLDFDLPQKTNDEIKTPTLISDLNSGEYRIKVFKEGFKEFETKIHLDFSTLQPVVVKLEKL